MERKCRVCGDALSERNHTGLCPTHWKANMSELAAKKRAERAAEAALNPTEPPSDPPEDGFEAPRKRGRPPGVPDAEALPALQVPAEWGVLPLKARWEDEIEWVHQNRSRCILIRSNGSPKVNLFVSRNPAPSEGALGLMQMAAMDSKGFNDLLKAAKKGESGEEEGELKRAERKSVAEITRIIEKYA